MQAVPEHRGASVFPCCSAAAMALNHSEKAAMSLPVALFTTAAGMPPISTSPPADEPVAADGGRVSSKEEGKVGSETGALLLLRGMVALRQMHSSNCRLAGGHDTDTYAPGSSPMAAASEGCMVQCWGWVSA